MKLFANSPRRLRSSLDIAEALGLRPRATNAEISRAFGQATNFDAVLEIEEESLAECATERWEVRILRARPHCLVELRIEGRGTWMTRFDGVPSEVVQTLCLRQGRHGAIETRRSWADWRRLDWEKSGGRRLRGRSGEVRALMPALDVSRPTGEVRCRLKLEPNGYEDRAEPVRLALPCARDELVAAISYVRGLCWDQASI